MATSVKSATHVNIPPKEDVLNDYRLVNESRQASLLGRKEVFMGKAKFGIFGDGKELAQIAMAKVFQEGDFRSGYYRDQTFMFAIGQLTVTQYFAQLYANPDPEADPSSAGRLMNGHFATRMLDANGQYIDLTQTKNSSSDVSPTGSQMPRLLGLAWASKLFRNSQDLQGPAYSNLSNKGNEVAFGTIGNASSSEGMFFEAVNAAGVMQVPMIVCVWDDDYGISVPKEYHTTGGSISRALGGMQRDEDHLGYEIFTARGWNYEELMRAFEQAAEVSRTSHVPCMIHVVEMTQPQGHSTSGSHERYKSKERLEWEKEYDCIEQFKKWILSHEIATEEELEAIEKDTKNSVRNAKNEAWKAFMGPINETQQTALTCIKTAADGSQQYRSELLQIHNELENTLNPIRSDAFKAIKKALRHLRQEPQNPGRQVLLNWLEAQSLDAADRFNSYLYDETDGSALSVPVVAPEYNDQSQLVDGREVLQACFDAALARDPRVVAFGEDVGKIGDVNQAFAGLQEKYGIDRVSDTSIRECTIIGQGIGLAMRGLRPIAEIQYLDYLLYAIQILSDDLATIQYRTKGGQKAPLIVRTRGHRLEGMWHAGSPLGMIINSLRGMWVLVPRDMTQAAGFYNTLLKGNDPGIIIECLNGYRLKEKLPANVGDYTVPLGVPEVIRQGTDVTVVTYGSMCRIVADAAAQLEEAGISVEIVDVQSLLPFDLHHSIVESLKKTNRVVFADEDVPGGASAYMMQKVLEEQNGYRYLDAKPLTITAQEHRPAYASDGDYFSKPNVETVFDKIYDLMAEADPQRFPDIY